MICFLQLAFANQESFLSLSSLTRGHFLVFSFHCFLSIGHLLFGRGSPGPICGDCSSSSGYQSKRGQNAESPCRQRIGGKSALWRRPAHCPGSGANEGILSGIFAASKLSPSMSSGPSAPSGAGRCPLSLSVEPGDPGTYDPRHLLCLWQLSRVPFPLKNSNEEKATLFGETICRK